MGCPAEHNSNAGLGRVAERLPGKDGRVESCAEDGRCPFRASLPRNEVAKSRLGQKRAFAPRCRRNRGTGRVAPGERHDPNIRAGLSGSARCRKLESRAAGRRGQQRRELRRRQRTYDSVSFKHTLASIARHQRGNADTHRSRRGRAVGARPSADLEGLCSVRREQLNADALPEAGLESARECTNAVREAYRCGTSQSLCRC